MKKNWIKILKKKIISDQSPVQQTHNTMYTIFNILLKIKQNEKTKYL